jgi:hypothetical protein
MKFLDKVALNRFIKIMTDFVLAVKMFKPADQELKTKPKRPVRDLLRRLWP